MHLTHSLKIAGLLAVVAGRVWAADEGPVLAGTLPLTWTNDLSASMVAGIDRFLMVAPAGLEPDLGVEGGVLTVEQHLNGAGSVVAQTPGIRIFANLERQPGLARLMGGDVPAQLAPGLAGRENQLRVVAEVFD